MFTREDLLAIVKPHNDKIVMLSVLREVEEFLDQQADVDDGRPNDAMRLLVDVRAVIRSVEA